MQDCACARLSLIVFSGSKAATQSEIVCRSVLSCWADRKGQSTTIYKHVLSANKRIEHPMCLTISLK